MKINDPIVMVGAARTPIGSFQGAFSTISAPQLGGTAIKAALIDAKISADDVDEVVMGLCLFAGVKQAPARQASHLAKIPWSAGATTISKMCGSGMKAAMLAHDNLVAGSHKIVIAGGMESMTNSPYLLMKARSGYRLGHGDKMQDHMFIDGLEDAYESGKLMGSFAEDTAEYYQFTRDDQDCYAIESLKRATQATKNGTFSQEISSISIQRQGEVSIISTDEQPFINDIKKIPRLKPAFKKNGTVTAANSSSISDGAAALILMNRSESDRRNLSPIATIIAHSTNSHEPNWFTTAPIGAIQNVLQKAKWKNRDVDLYEVNEAFAVVPMAAMRDLDISADRMNVHGGACALGHPVGASGARIIVTLINALRKHNLTRGIAALCIGGGEATAMAIEMVN